MGREIMRVRLDFDWPLNKVYEGRLSPERLRETPCSACEGGYSPRATELKNLWYGYVPFRPEDNGSTPFTIGTPEVRAFAERNVSRSPEFYGHGDDAVRREAQRLCDLWNGQWSHHLDADDVAALIEAGRLRDFTHDFDPDRDPRFQPIDPPPDITPEMVNRWSLCGFGHDSINQFVVATARCEREGVPSVCQVCDGHGSHEAYPGQRAEAEAWEPSDPPTGDGWQLWETTSEGSPVGPVFATAEELAQWLTTEEGGSAVGFGRSCTPMTIESARGFVGEGWAPSMIGNAGGLHDGAEYVGTAAVLREHEQPGGSPPPASTDGDT